MKHGVTIAEVIWHFTSSLSATSPVNIFITAGQIGLKKYSLTIFLILSTNKKSSHQPVK